MRPRWHWLALSPWLAGLTASCVLLGWPVAASAQVRHHRVRVNMTAAEPAAQSVMDTALRNEGSGGQARREQIRFYTAVERKLEAARDRRQEAALDRWQAAQAAARAAARAAAKRAAHARTPAPQPARTAVSPPQAGIYSYSQLEALWVGAGGPAAVEAAAAAIAECESGGNPRAYNPSGASGLWQILGVPFPGDPFNGPVNARMAVAKYVAAGDSFSPWVCQP